MIIPTDTRPLADMSIQAELDPRPAFAAERILQAAFEGSVTWWERHSIDGYSYITAEIDGREVTDAEYRAIVDLLDSEHVLTDETEFVRITDRGRDLLARWASYVPLRGDQR